MEILKKYWWIAILVVGLLVVSARSCGAADIDEVVATGAQIHGQAELFYEQSLAEGDQGESSRFALDDVKLWLTNDFNENTTSTITIQLDSTNVDVREAYVSHGFGKILRAKAGIFENRFGTADFWPDYGNAPFIGPNESFNRLGTPIPIADLGLGADLQFGDKFAATTAVFNGTGYQSIEVNTSKDLMVNARFDLLPTLSFGGGVYKSFQGSEYPGYSYTSANSRFGSRSLNVTGEYLTRTDLFSDDDEAQPKDHSWIFTGEWVVGSTVGLVGRVEIQDATSTYSVGDVSSPEAALSTFDRVTAGVNYYPASLDKHVVAQVHVTTTDPDAEDILRSSMLQTQVAWQF